MAYESARVLITVKAQPALSQKHGEVVCVAGVRTDRNGPEWIRLFPVQFRDLPYVRRFEKYRFVDLRITRAKSDPRPESFTPDLTSISPGTHLDAGPRGTWRKRWEVLAPLADQVSMCELNRRQRANEIAPSLAIIRPSEIVDVRVSDTPDFTVAQRNLAEIAAAADLFGQARTPLEPPPFTVKYVYRCHDCGSRKHEQTCVDWEVGAAGRKWLPDMGRDGTVRALRKKFLDEMCGAARQPLFFVGNQHLHPQSYLVLGVFWPKVTNHDPTQLTLS